MRHVLESETAQWFQTAIILTYLPSWCIEPNRLAETTTVSDQQRALIDPLGEKPSCALLGCVLPGRLSEVQFGREKIMYANISKQMVPTFGTWNTSQEQIPV